MSYNVQRINGVGDVGNIRALIDGGAVPQAAEKVKSAVGGSGGGGDVSCSPPACCLVLMGIL